MKQRHSLREVYLRDPQQKNSGISEEKRSITEKKSHSTPIAYFINKETPFRKGGKLKYAGVRFELILIELQPDSDTIDMVFQKKQLGFEFACIAEELKEEEKQRIEELCKKRGVKVYRLINA